MYKNVYKKAGKLSSWPELENTEVGIMQTEQEQASEFRLQIRLFGALEVRLDGAPIPPLRSRKVQWLLALLVLRHDQALDRAWLAGALWPDSAPEQALYNLRQSLTSIRHALGKAAVCLQASMVNALSLDVASAEVDVLLFDADIAAGDNAALERAVALYRGPLLEGCAEEWIFAERRVREENYLSALDKLANQARACGEGSAAVRYLRAAIQTDPFREQTQRVLIQALAAQGDYGAAVQSYRDLRLLLHRELNTDPDPETVALFQQIQAEARRKRDSTPIAPLSQPAASARRLPCPLTPLIGRKTEQEQIVSTLNDSRLLTLTGTGGVGKTRLAIAVAEQVAAKYPDGVFFVDLAPLSDPTSVVPAVARALQIQEESGAPLLSTLQEALHPKTLLLLLDNCEHLLDACATLTDILLQNCPGIRVLTASRQHLGLTGEVVWKVTSLSTPALCDLTDGSRSFQKDQTALLSEYEAVQLFVIRAQQALPSFQMTPRNAQTVARICAHLDGLPLALELAAARVRSLSVEEIYSKIQDRFRLLTGGSRAALPRQKTLRALMDWSYDLLSEAERTLLCRLSVFAGGWTLQAAEAVCPEESPDEEGTFEAWEVLGLLSSLVDKSLVMMEQEAGQTRYRLLETMRQYAQDRLQEQSDVDLLRRRHQVFFVALAEEAEPQLNGPDQATWLHRLEQDHANLRQALSGGNAYAALRLVGALWRYQQVRAYASEGRKWCAEALGGDGVQGVTSTRAKALHGAGVLAWSQSDYTAAHTLHEESLTLYRELADTDGIGTALQSLGNIASEHGDYARAQALYSESLTLRRKSGDNQGIATLLNNLGNIASDQGNLTTAQTLHEESLQIRRELGNKAGIASSLNNLGNVALDQEDYARARALYAESLALQRELGNKQGVAIALHSLGTIAYEQDDFATTHLLFAESLSLSHTLGYKRGLACTLEALGALALSEEQARRGAYLVSAAEALRTAIDGPMPPSDRTQHDTLLAQARTALGEENFALAWSEGGALSLEQVIEYALGGSLG
jgi:predicted ATPase/DNA-binding SARP family transcriptional activator/Tfp pilus assembly protein PilF